MRNTAGRVGRLKAVGGKGLQEVSEMLKTLGVPEDSSTVVRVTRHNGHIRSIQIVHPTQRVDPHKCSLYREVLDKLQAPEFGTASFEFAVDRQGEVVKIKRISFEETVDLKSLE